MMLVAGPFYQPFYLMVQGKKKNPKYSNVTNWESLAL